MTERLYFGDAYLRSFDARVTACGRWQGQPALALDRSAFYPAGGGQPADHGTIAGVAVCDVQLQDGVVWHVLAAPAPALQPGVAVSAEVDWARRFDHMQQHLGQHLLTAAFVATCGLATLSFHLGTDNATIDLDCPELSADLVQAAAMLANQVIWDNRPVTARFVEAAELAQLPLRKPPQVDGPVRVVSVPDFDYSACGGTHPRSTGGVGSIAVQRWFRQKNATRLEFVCGGRALHEYRRLNAISRDSAAALSVGVGELPATLARLQQTAAAQHKELANLREQLLVATADRWLAEAALIGPARVVCTELAAEQGARLGALARQLAAQPATVALLAVSSGARVHLAAACAPDLGLDARMLLQAGLAAIDGRGGGNAGLAQGSGPQVAGRVAALDAMQAALRTALQEG